MRRPAARDTSRRGRRLAVLGAAVLVLTPLSGCGSPEAAYCSRLRKDQATLGEMVSSKSAGALITGLPTLRGLAAVAPEDLTDEWQTFLNAVQGVADALHGAGLHPSRLGTGLPAGLDAKDRAAIAGAADTLASQDVVAASTGIETEARDVCKVDIGL